MTTIVLGWDGLDHDLVREFETGAAFGETTSKMWTLQNHIIGKPHTYELWPTIITGVDPETHGIHAEHYTHGGSWSNPALNAAAVVSKFVVPDPIRWRIGRMIRGRGATFDFESIEYYRDRGLWTIFDDRQSFMLGIPNCRSSADDALDIHFDRGAHLAAFMDIETGSDGETIHRPNVPLETFHHRLEADLAKKLGAVRSAQQWGYDLIFVWLGYLDTIGHVAPTVANPEEWVRSGYETAAEWTAFIHNHTEDDDVLICVSDHGLQDGRHSDHAFIGSWPGEHVRGCRDVREVAETIASITPKSDRLSEPHSASESKSDFDDVHDRLRTLGYVE